MRHELGHGPVEMARVADGQSLRGKSFRLQPGREQKHLELDVEGARGLVRRVQEIGQGRRIARRPRRLRHPKRRQRLGSDDPGRDGGQKALAEEGAERLVFPRLDVARRPIVQQAEARDVACRICDGNRYAQLVARSDPNSELELVVETAGRPEARHRFG